jgi:hypothetical protein
MALRWAASCVLGFLLLLVFHANRSTLNSTWLGPVGETSQSLQRGRAFLLGQDNAATISIIANTGAMLVFGQNRSKETAALAAEPGCD